MSHDTHSEHNTENKTVISFKNSFWLATILVGLFIGALNFIQAESGDEAPKGEVKENTGTHAAEPAKTEKAEKKEEPKAEKKAEEPKAAEPAATNAEPAENK